MSDGNPRKTKEKRTKRDSILFGPELIISND